MSIAIEEINRTNCKTYLLVKGSDGILVDPVRERFDTYRLLVTARGLRLRMVIETHTHADHLMLSRSAKEALARRSSCTARARARSSIITSTTAT